MRFQTGLQRNRTKPTSTFRFMVIRVTSTYRTISSEFVCVIDRMIPICITLAENVEAFREEGLQTQREWLMQTRWLSGSKSGTMRIMEGEHTDSFQMYRYGRPKNTAKC